MAGNRQIINLRKPSGAALMGFNLRRWLFEPEYQVVSALYACKRLDSRGNWARPLSRWLWRRYVIGNGCFISPLASIGTGLHLPHPIGIVVSEDACIGNNVTLYQNVTLGRVTADRGGAPMIEDGATIYAGAVILGTVRIGAGAVIGANSVVRIDVPGGAVAAGAPAAIIPPAALRHRP